MELLLATAGQQRRLLCPAERLLSIFDAQSLYWGVQLDRLRRQLLFSAWFKLLSAQAWFEWPYGRRQCQLVGAAASELQGPMGRGGCMCWVKLAKALRGTHGAQNWGILYAHLQGSQYWMSLTAAWQAALPCLLHTVVAFQCRPAAQQGTYRHTCIDNQPAWLAVMVGRSLCDF